MRFQSRPSERFHGSLCGPHVETYVGEVSHSSAPCTGGSHMGNYRCPPRGYDRSQQQQHQQPPQDPLQLGPPPRLRWVLLALVVVVVLPMGGLLTCAACADVRQTAARANVGADIGTTKTACNSVKSVALLWKGWHPDLDCPTVEQLKNENFLDTGFAPTDAWGNAFRIACATEDVTCSTAGPDRTEGTQDDIIVPTPESTVSTPESTPHAEPLAPIVIPRVSAMGSFAGFTTDTMPDDCDDAVPTGMEANARSKYVESWHEIEPGQIQARNGTSG